VVALELSSFTYNMILRFEQENTYSAHSLSLSLSWALGNQPHTHLWDECGH